jgi:phospholipid transport system substrate-binding protein
MKHRYLRRIAMMIFFVAAIFSSVLVSAGDAGPTVFLKSNDKKLKPLLADTTKNRQKILKTINAMMDFDALCKASLGKHWSERTPEERKNFSETLRALIEKNLIKRLKDSKDHVITYGDETVSGDTAQVSTTVKAGSGPRADETEVVYKMHKKSGKWIVTDMITDEVSLVNNYQSQFNKIITEEGWAALMKKMTDKLAERE